MFGCLSGVAFWLIGTAAIFYFGVEADEGPGRYAVAGVLVGYFATLSIYKVVTRPRLSQLVAEYVRQYGPLPEETKAMGTRLGGTAGRVAGGSTGYLVGGVVGAAVDAYKERQKYAQMSEAQKALLFRVGQLQLVRPVFNTVLLVGALVCSWIAVAVLTVFFGALRPGP